MIIDPENEFIALQGEEYRDLRRFAHIFNSPVSPQKIASYFRKSGIALMAEIDKQITKAEKQ